MARGRPVLYLLSPWMPRRCSLPTSDIQTNWLYIAISIGLLVCIPVFYKIHFTSKNADMGS
jgi:hypothetical protein